MPNIFWDEISYPFLNFNGCAVEVMEWIINFIAHFIMDIIAYPCWDQSQSMLVKGATDIKPHNCRASHWPCPHNCCVPNKHCTTLYINYTANQLFGTFVLVKQFHWKTLFCIPMQPLIAACFHICRNVFIGNEVMYWAHTNHAIIQISDGYRGNVCANYQHIIYSEKSIPLTSR